MYARPAFIRVTQQMALTSTFKHQKGDFAKEGYDLAKIQHGDKVYFYNVKVSLQYVGVIMIYLLCCVDIPLQ